MDERKIPNGGFESPRQLDLDKPTPLTPARGEFAPVPPASVTGQPSLLRPPRQPWIIPLVLLLATCASTFLIGGLGYAASLITILGAHELGHYIQARRYRVPASLPYFIPFPISVVGTLGAFITMQPGVANRRSLFDIAITGPLAGLIPAIVFSVIGLRYSTVVELSSYKGVLLGEPILFKLLSYLTFGSLGDGQDILLHPIGYAGWVGIFITALNLIPIGQLDGGHILYALIGKKSHTIAIALLAAAAVASIWAYRGWLVMMLLLFFMGPKHPPTSDDNVPLGLGRTILGWLALLFVVIGFTPQPFSFRWPVSN